MDYQNIMLDIETLDTTPSAVVLSIGAVKFNVEGIGETFYATLRASEQDSRTQSASTLEWWSKQSPEAKAAVFPPHGAAESVRSALARFVAFFDHDKYDVWGNGAAFDNVIVKHLLAQYGLECPWRYSGDRCFRTLKALVYSNFPNLKESAISYGTAHNALDDAIAQAQELLRIEARTQIVLNVDMSDPEQIQNFNEVTQ